jgi:hypothetical protein
MDTGVGKVMRIRNIGAAIGLSAAAGLMAAACSSSSPSSHASVASSGGQSAQAVAAVDTSASKTLAAGSADVAIDLSVSGGVTAALSGGFDFANGDGSLDLHLSGLPAAEASLVPSPLPLVFTNGSLYLKAVGPIALADGNKPWAELTPQALQGVLGLVEPKVDFGTFSKIAAGNPADLLKILATPDMTVTSKGSTTVNGAQATEYQVTLNASKAAKAATGPVAQIYRALGSSSAPLDVWIDGQGRLVMLQTKIVPTGAPAVALQVTISNFGTQVTIPPIAPSEVGQLAIPVPGAGASGAASTSATS